MELRCWNERRKHLPPGHPMHLAPSASCGGTAIGVARAVQLSRRECVTPRAVKRIRSYLLRHAGDKDAEGFGDDNKPSAGYVAWLLWGGDPALAWVERIWELHQTSQA